MNLEILLFVLKVSVFIWLPIGGIFFAKRNNRAGGFCIFVSVSQFIIYLLTKNKFNIKDPAFLETKSELIKLIFIYAGIALALIVIGLCLWYFCFYLKNERKKLRELKPKYEELCYYDLWELFNRYHDASVSLFGKIRDEKLYEEAMNIKDLMLKKENELSSKKIKSMQKGNKNE